ncbi:ergothioneine biosynthesis glutamate--cysteine ligase EgtA [Actinomadura alba]|uniref:ergothioneine biosynthesis glutamate--cysteine ligase EgtA n=1 Tax=Actinomadura alba TaxID=406431 RepID=UPI00164FBA25|nr:ergothioneine biosynthesis glutamate--cysteine ligase EgtA [Actinomadura alba]
MTRLTIDDVYAHVSGVCFKTGPPGTVGAETEWLVADSADPGAHVPLARLRTLVDAAGPLPAGSRVTYEPGGQLELSTAPFPGPGALHSALAADLSLIRAHLADHGVVLVGHGIDPLRGPLLQNSDARYRCMSDYFGAAGLAPMCTTASVQVCLDIGADRDDALRRWRLAHSLGPVLVASFANSALRAGRRTGLRSTRQALWSGLDAGRTAVPAGADPVEAWSRYALDARVMLIRGADGDWISDPGMSFREWVTEGGPTGGPTEQDLSYHLSTLFPPVRPRGWLELRMIDAVPDPYWPVPMAVATALFDDPRATEVAEEATRPIAGCWREAVGDALTDPALAAAARRCFTAAIEALPRLGAAALVPIVVEYAERYVERGRCPADDLDLADAFTVSPSSTSPSSTSRSSTSPRSTQPQRRTFGAADHPATR